MLTTNGRSDEEQQAPAGSASEKALAVDNPLYSSAERFAYLFIWLLNNMGVTLINKAAFKWVEFKYPFMLSATHMLVNAIGSHVWLKIYRDGKTPAVDPAISPAKRRSLLVLFSLLFSANICVGNISILFVSINFNQVMRSLVPAVVMVIGAVCQGKRFSMRRTVSVVVVVIGVTAACFGEMTVTFFGFLVTLLCVVLASAKVVLTGAILIGAGLQLSPMELIHEMAPLSMLWMSLASYSTGELSQLLNEIPQLSETMAFPVVLLSAVLAFIFNISSFVANKVSSPLTLTIWGNIKQVLLIVVSTYLFDTQISVLNGAGITLVIIASGVYNYYSAIERGRSSKQ